MVNARTKSSLKKKLTGQKDKEIHANTNRKILSGF
jgi:hypothetical protein